MRAVYFIEVDGIKYYKCDTFWSKSSKQIHAKIHDDSEYDQKRFFDSLIYGFKPYKEKEWKDEDYPSIKKYENSLYGYQTILDEESKETAFTLKEDSNLSEPIYLIKIETISKSGEVESYDYRKVINRETKINQIIND